ncbi:hypothetical protein DN752_02160 [Echinicola strongylocentroti]|uniref:Uncharacterized protein n=1 Tax=Echinicola strongylocentroti TaxID=1795355 RepID=A0A2Z4IDY6_9BACT|nr:hypothetical protein [Echinicola strongylocentroti]AWW29035.1 hypothetical protein DN752_02160 [Echinicola strongylocentroti]
MKKENEFFSFSRFIQLLKYDFQNNRFHYLTAIPGAMLALGIILWVFFPDFHLSHEPSWRATNFLPFIILGYLIFGILIAGNSFPGFKSKTATIGYLTLPASTFEKFTAQWVIRILLFMVLYPLIFKITANLTASLYMAFHSPPTASDFAGQIEYFTFVKAFDLDQPDRAVNFFICTIVISFPTLGISLLFLTSTFFKKWNALLGPLSILVLLFVILFYNVTIFHLLDPFNSIFLGNEVKLEHPKVINNTVPLVFFSAVCLVILLCFICWLTTYFRLKEKQV